MTAEADDPAPVTGALGKHRIEALTDGIYAVAMTLLVIELKLPDPHTIATAEELREAITHLIPKAGSWLVSFFVLATFWIGHHRLYQSVRVVDTKLLWRNLYQLALVSLLPFSASLMGEFGNTIDALVIYNANMILMSVVNVLQLRYVKRHPELQVQGHPLTTGAYHAALVRMAGLIGAGVSALVIAQFLTRLPVLAIYTYLVMWPVSMLSGRIVRRDQRQSRPS